MDLELFLLIGSRFGQDLDPVLERRHILLELEEVGPSRLLVSARAQAVRRTRQERGESRPGLPDPLCPRSAWRRASAA